jgi:hypothetical protein
MKPFKIKKNSWHYKLNANFMQDNFMSRWEQYHSDFCSYWRATIGRLILAGFMLITTLFILSASCRLVYLNPVAATLTVGAILLVFALGIFAAWLAAWLVNRSHNGPSKSDSLFVQKYKAHKAKICPMVEYEEN